MICFKGSFPGINDLNEYGNTVQENRPRLAVPKHERLQAPICAGDGKTASVDQPCQPSNLRGAQYQVDWGLRIGCSRRRAPRGGSTGPHPNLHKVVSLIYTPTTTYPFVISNCKDMTASQVSDEVLYTGLIEMQELDAPG